jgi:NADH-quinone oxidoreductase subunit G
VVKAAAEIKGATPDAPVAGVTVSEAAHKIAASLCSGRNQTVLLGNFARQHPKAVTLHALALQLGQITGATVGVLSAAANTVGARVAKALPQNGGLNTAAQLAEPRQAYLLLGAEPELDCADGKAALAALAAAKTVIMLSPFKSAAALEYADVILPISPFSETSGTFVSMEGRAQSFYAVAKPLGETRPAWKVLRVLGNLLELPGFDYESSEQVRDEVLGGKPEFVAGLSNELKGATPDLSAAGVKLERVADVPAYFGDSLVRRAPSLQATEESAAPVARLNAATLAELGISSGAQVRVTKGDETITLKALADEAVPAGAARVAAAHASTVALGSMFGALTVEKA